MEENKKLKHTPGPWGKNGNSILKRTGIGQYSVMAILYDDEKETGKANANLIAAAPDMLQALIEFTNSYKESHDSGDWGNWDLNEDMPYVKAMEAIKKATE